MSIWPAPYNPPYLVFDTQDFDNYWKSFQPKDGQLICKPKKMNMKPQIALSIAQMQELRSLGMDCSDASMCWVTPLSTKEPRLALRPEGSHLVKHKLLLELNYAYTLEDVLMKLPPSFEINEEDDIFQYDLGIFPHWRSELWCVKYKGHFGDLKVINARDLIKCAFEMLKWVLRTYPDKIKS